MEKQLLARDWTCYAQCILQGKNCLDISNLKSINGSEMNQLNGIQ